MEHKPNFAPPVDAKTVQALLSDDLKRAVTMYGQAWFLSVREFWPACSQHEKFIADIESRAGGHFDNPFAEPTSSSSRARSIEAAKVEMPSVDSDITAWLDQVESAFSNAEFAEAAWIDLASAYMEKLPKICWAASEQLVLEKTAKDHFRPWDGFKDWCKTHLDGKGLAENQLSVLKQSTAAGCKAEFQKIVANADLPSEEAVACWIAGLQPNIQALSQALSQAVAEFLSSHNTPLEPIQSAAVAVEADPKPAQTNVVVAQPACSGKSKRRKALSKNKLQLASVRAYARVQRQGRSLRLISLRLRLASASASSVASLAT